MRNRLEYQTVVLAALLQDLGEFLQRGRDLAFGIQGTEPEVSGQFVNAFADVFKAVSDVDLLRTLVTRHHQDKAEEATNNRARLLAYLVTKADRLSSGQRGERAEDHRDYRTTPLAPVFQRVFSTARPESQLRYHPFFLGKPDAFSEKSFFPDSFQAYAAGELETTTKAFDEQANSILNSIGSDFSVLTSHMLALLQSYTPAVPADTQEAAPDTSVYDHMKTTAAIAACLYQVHDAHNDWEIVREDDTARFTLVVGDVSGIQKYVFEIAEKDRSGGGIAKRLRARSLFVQLISEVAPLQILGRFDLPLTNILMASGGKFYVLLPALPNTEKTLQDYRQFAEDWFLHSFRGALGLNLAWVSGAEPGLGKGFGDTIKLAMAALDTKKEQGLGQSLTIANRWNSSAFVLPPFPKGERPCPSCGKFSAPELDLCPQCLNDVEWGRSLPRADYVTVSLEGESGGRELLGAKVKVGGPDALAGRTSLVLHVNNPDVRPAAKHCASFRYLARHVPVGGSGEVKDFKEIAGKSHGRHYLGFFKADVDNMGSIFAFGLRDDGAERWGTPSRIATMSRQLDLFFTGWVEHLLESEFKDCYCVFSGGDDLFIIGPWNQALDFVTKLNHDFTKYTCHNSKITLSAGMVIESHNYPAGQAADEAGDAVEKSKTAGRNRVTLLGRTLTWDEWAGIKKLWETLREEKTSSAFLYSLLDYDEMWQKYKSGDVSGLRFQPLLAYNLRRNLNRRNNKQFYEWAERLLEWKPNSGNKEIEKTLNNLGLIAQLLILWKGGS